MWLIAFDILKKYWKLITVGLVILSAVLYMRGLYNTIDTQANRITELNTANTILKDNNDKLHAAIDVNSAAINKLAQGAVQTNKAFAGLNGSVKNQTNTLDAKLAGILRDKKPVTCEATIQYLIEASKEFKK